MAHHQHGLASIHLKKIEAYLLSKWVYWGKKSIPLTVDSRTSTTTNSIHFPVCVVVVHYMEVSMPTPANTIYIFIRLYNLHNLSNHTSSRA